MSKEENIILPVIALGGILLIFSQSNNAPPPATNIPGTALTPTNFILKYWNEAKSSQAATTIPALVTITQAGLESGWGAHAPQFNFFGIKDSSGWTGATQILPTTEYVNGVLTHTTAKFRAYPSAHAGFVDHGRFFIDNSRYKTALQYVDDPGEFIRQIALAGYATDPQYANKLINAANVVIQVLQSHKLI